MSDKAMKSAHDALDRLLDCHGLIAEEYSELPDEVLDRLLGNASPECMLRELRKRGDGYSLRSVPARTGEMTPAGDVILIVGSFPLLGRGAEFDPCVHLTRIPYWNVLRPTLRMPDRSERRLRFLIWQDRCPMHGETIGDALRNRDFIRRRAPRLSELFDREAELSMRLLAAWATWLGGVTPRRRVIVVASGGHDLSRFRIAGLVDGGNPPIEIHQMWSNKRLIMDRIKERLCEAEGLRPANR